MGALFSATYRADNDRPTVEVKAAREGNSESWKVTAQCAGARCEAATDAPDPTPTIWRLIGEALDSKADSDAPPQWDMNTPLRKSAAPITSLRRRGKIQPGDLPEWKPPETA
jgi:hypothetical protein